MRDDQTRGDQSITDDLDAHDAMQDAIADSRDGHVNPTGESIPARERTTKVITCDHCGQACSESEDRLCSKCTAAFEELAAHEDEQTEANMEIERLTEELVKAKERLQAARQSKILAERAMKSRAK